MCGVIKNTCSDTDPEKLVRYVSGDLGRAADPGKARWRALKIRSAARSNASGSKIERVSSRAWSDVRKTFCASSLPVSSERVPGVDRSRLTIVVVEGGAKVFKPREAELLYDFDDHRLGDPSIVGDRLEWNIGVEIAPSKHCFHHTCLKRCQVGHHHPDAWPHRSWISEYDVHSRPLVARSISMAARMIRPVARS